VTRLHRVAAVCVTATMFRRDGGQRIVRFTAPGGLFGTICRRRAGWYRDFAFSVTRFPIRFGTSVLAVSQAPIRSP